MNLQDKTWGATVDIQLVLDGEQMILEMFEQPPRRGDSEFSAEIEDFTIEGS